MSSRLGLVTFVCLVAFLPLLAETDQKAMSCQEEIRVEVIPAECEEGLRAVVESQILKATSAQITKKDPSHRLRLTCHWQQGPPGSTSFHSSWGNADVTIRVETVAEESTLYSESFTAGAKSRGLAMKKAAERAVADLLKSRVLPRKR